MAVSDKVSLGTSGWSYKEWIGPFYTAEDKSMLSAYVKVFRTVEIDSTFYRYPSKGMVMGWTRYSPEGFLYAAKLPQLITHEKKLDLAQGIEEDINRFVELMEPLWTSGKLGCILIQLPPRFKYDLKNMEDFFTVLPSQIKFAVEFRHPSWMRPETWKLLEKYSVAYTVVDEPLLPPEVHITSDFAYFRWHGRGTRPWYNYQYKTSELKPWVPKVKAAAENVKRVYGFFNNHYHGFAVENCLQVLEMLGALTAKQAEVKRRVENYLKTQMGFKTPRLEAFAQTSEGSLESILCEFMDVERLRRATEIGDNELHISKDNPMQIEASVREYHIVIDLENRTLLHDCADWGKGLGMKRFCKHIGKLFLFLDPSRSTALLREIRDQKDSWQFKPYT